jgi:hypothetical protein
LVKETRFMSSKTQSRADHPNAQLPSGSSAPESEPVILLEDEVATREGVGLSSPESSDVGYHECRNKTDKLPRVLGGLAGQISQRLNAPLNRKEKR